MPKVLVPGDWVQQTCLFRQKTSEVCQLCERPFTMFNRARYCSYCGRAFHRRDCSNKKLGGHRTCTHCDEYRSVLRDKLSNGEVFECMSRGLELRLSLCESTAEMVLHWTQLNLKETVDLLQVELKKGFTHCGHLQNGYEPLKSMSLVIKGHTVLDLKTTSAWTCQLWVDGLKAAQYVYRCMLQQEETRLQYLDNGVTVQSSWFTTYYLIDSEDPTPPQHTLPPSPLTTHNLTASQPDVTPAQSTVTLSPRKHFHTSTRHNDSVVSSHSRPLASIDSGYHSDVLLRPSEVKGHRVGSPLLSSIGSLFGTPSSHRHTPLLTGSHPHTRHRLPYRSSQLSTLCRCHDYEILPSRSVDFVSPSVQNVSLPRCCKDCVDTCKIAKDLDNL